MVVASSPVEKIEMGEYLIVVSGVVMTSPWAAVMIWSEWMVVMVQFE